MTDAWMRRRGAGASEREWNAPWARLQQRLLERYEFDVDPARRWERPPPEDPTSLPLLLRQASAAVDADVRGALRAVGHGITPTELDILLRLSVKASVGVNLSEYLRIGPTSVSRALARLDARGLVHRSDDSMDLRARTAELAPAGRSLVTAITPHLQALADLWLEELDDDGDEAKAVLVRLVATLADLT